MIFFTAVMASRGPASSCYSSPTVLNPFPAPGSSPSQDSPALKTAPASLWTCRCRFFILIRTVRPASNTNPYTLPLQLTPPGTLTAHGKFCLVLLCSQPDTVHRHPLRKTQTSSPLIKGSHTGAGPRPDITPAIADFRYRGPLLPRLHGLHSILSFFRFVNGLSLYFPGNQLCRLPVPDSPSGFLRRPGMVPVRHCGACGVEGSFRSLLGHGDETCFPECVLFIRDKDISGILKQRKTRTQLFVI